MSYHKTTVDEYEELLKQAMVLLEEPLSWRENTNPYNEYFEERVEFAEKIKNKIREVVYLNT